MAARDLVTQIADGYDPEGGLAESALRRLEWRMRRSGKRCRVCREVLPLAAFARDVSRADGLARRCRTCHAEARLAEASRVPLPGPLL